MSEKRVSPRTPSRPRPLNEERGIGIPVPPPKQVAPPVKKN